MSERELHQIIINNNLSSYFLEKSSTFSRLGTLRHAV